MKKFYLLVLMCCLGLQGYSYTSTTFYSSVPGDVTVLTNWSTTVLPGTVNPTPADFADPTNTFKVISSMYIGGGETWSIGGTVILSATPNSKITKRDGPASTINISGPLQLLGTSKITTSLSTGALNIYLDSSLSVLGASSISAFTSDSIFVHFSGSGRSYSNPQLITWTSTAISTNANIIIDKNSFVQLASNVPLPQNAAIADSINGTLICGTYIMSSNATDTLVISSGATVYTANAGGLDSSLKQLYQRDYSQMANYIYNGTVAQVTGTTLPGIIGVGSHTGSVTINNPAGVTLSQDESFVSSILNLEQGTLINGTHFSMSVGGMVNVDIGTFAAAPTYDNSITVTYEPLGSGASAVTTGYELVPGGGVPVNNVYISNPGAIVTLGSPVSLNNIYLMEGTLNAASTGIDIINGNFTNNESAAAFVPAGGVVAFFGTTGTSVIGGSSSTIFDNVTVDRLGSGISIADNETINNTLSLYNGLLNIYQDTLFFGPTANPVAGTPSGTNMIVADSTGMVAKVVPNTDNTSYLFPIGDRAGHYAPVTYSNLLAGGAYIPGRYLAVNEVPKKPTVNANTNNYLNRYWNVYLNNFPSATYAVTTNFLPADVTGSYTLMSMGEYTGALPWIRYNPATATTLTSPATVSSLSSLFSGIGTTLPTITSTASMEICNLAPVTLNVLTSSGDAPLTYSWAPSTGLSATTGTSVVLTPSATGVTVYTVTITDGNGFTAAATTAVTVNPAPSIGSGSTVGITNSTPVCVDGAITFGAAGPISNVTTYSWSGPGVFSSGAGTVSPIIDSAQLSSAGVYSLTVTNGPGLGCSVTYTTTVVVNDTAAPVIVTGGGVFCNSASVTATGGGAGNTIFYEDVVSLGTGTTIDESTFPIVEYTSGTYYFRARTPLPAACWGTQSSVTVTINPLPDNHSVYVDGPFVPGYYCAGDTGLHIGLSDGSELGVSYQVYHGGVAVGTAKLGTGTTDTLNLGLFSAGGNYAVIATNTTTGCTNLMNLTGSDSTLINIQPLPTQYPFDVTTLMPSHLPGYCANTGGTTVGLANTDLGINYQLFVNSWDSVGTPNGGVGGPLDFGIYTTTGKYKVIATDLTYGCIDTMTSVDSVYILPLPNVYHVTGHDTECADGPGFFLGLSNGDAGVTYAIYENLFGSGPGTAFATASPGTSGAFAFSTLSQPGPATPGDYYYTVIATDNVTGCIDTMADSGNIHVNPLPFDYGMGGGGQYCADSAIASTVYIYGTDPGFNYQLYNNGVAYGPVRVGTGYSLTWGPTTDTGTYSVVATNPATGCYITFAATVRIQQNPRPNIYAVSGGGTECADGPGFMISLPNSDDATVTYYLYENGVIVSTLPGASGPLSFGPEQPAPATAGNYTYDIVAVSAATCYSAMTDSGFIHVNPLPGIFTVTGGGAYCINDTIKYHIGLSGSETGIQYQLYRADTAIRSALHGTGVSLDYGLTDTVATYTIVATNPGNTCTLNMLSSATITANTLPTVEIVTGGGSYCYGTGGLPVGLANTQTAPISYQLYNNGTAVGTGVTSTGGAITFGAEVLAGTYTVSATNTVTGCKDSMANPVRMTIKPLPTVFTIAGGGSYCTGDTGRHIYLSGSIPTVKYQLLQSATPVSVLRGTGFGLDYGIFTTPATYVITAADTVSGCTDSMAGTVSISINPLPQVWNVTGGGIACAGTGFPVSLANSNTGIRYQLYRNSVPVGAPIAGTTGSSIDFGTETISGTYTVIGTNVSTLCANKMTDSATVQLNPLPVVFPMTGGGTLCSGGTGHEIGLAGSEVGVTYQMYTAGLPIGGPELGTGSAIEFGAETLGGTYFAVGVNTTTMCSDTMRDTAVIIVNPLPTAYDMNGGGTYCISDSGVHVGLTHSDTGILYQLYLDSFATGSPVAGTGDSLDFGLQTAPGTYTVTAIRPSTGCTGGMSSTETVTVVTHLTPVVTLTASQGTNIAVGQADTLIAHVTGAGTGPTYQWYINGNPIPGATRDTFFFNSYYFDLDSIVCAVTSTGLCGDITTNQIIVLTLYTNGVQQVSVHNSDIKLAPNPNKGAFTVKGSLGTTADEEVEMEITDMLGQAIYKTKVMATGGMLNEQIHLGNTLANGMYLLNVRTATQSHVFHFVMEQ